MMMGLGGDNEVQRIMLELINQLDGFDLRSNIKVLMATNRPDTLDPALMRWCSRCLISRAEATSSRSTPGV